MRGVLAVRTVLNVLCVGEVVFQESLSLQTVQPAHPSRPEQKGVTCWPRAQVRHPAGTPRWSRKSHPHMVACWLNRPKTRKYFPAPPRDAPSRRQDPPGQPPDIQAGTRAIHTDIGAVSHHTVAPTDEVQFHGDSTRVDRRLVSVGRTAWQPGRITPDDRFRLRLRAPARGSAPPGAVKRGPARRRALDSPSQRLHIRPARPGTCTLQTYCCEPRRRLRSQTSPLFAERRRVQNCVEPRVCSAFSSHQRR